MRQGAAVALLLGILAASITAVAASSQPPTDALSSDPALRALRECRLKLPPTAIGWPSIAPYCPGLNAQLERSPWIHWLPQSWQSARSDLSAGGLAELERLIRREVSLTPRSPTLDPQVVRAAVASLGAAAERGDGVGSRLQRWLQWWVDARQRDAAPGGSGWIEPLLRQGSSTSFGWQLASYLLLLAVLGIVALIAINEWRIAGRRRLLSGSGVADAAAPVEDAEPVLGDVPLAQRPAILLRRVLELMAARGLLAASGHLTSAEIVAQVSLDQRAGRERFAALVKTAEAVRYGAELPAQSLLDASVANGGQLIEALRQR